MKKPSGGRATPPVATQAQSSYRWLLPALGVLVLAAAIWGVYGRALDAPFNFDDLSVVLHNQSIKQLWPLYSARAESPLNPSDGPFFGRPIVNLTFAINYYFGQLAPRGYHAVNIALHFFTALILWSLVRRTLQLDYFDGTFTRVAGPLGFASAIVWALHPLASETVLYVTQRSEGLMALFYLATFYASLRYWETNRRGARAAWLIAATISCGLGMLSKEMMISVGAMLLLYERTFLAGSFWQALRRSWPLYGCMMLGALPLLLINRHGPKTPLAGFNMGVAAIDWWLVQCKVLLIYLKLTVWPWPLSLAHDIRYFHSFREALPSVLAVAALAGATIWFVWRRSAVGFVGTWLFAVLSPTLVIPLIDEVLVERRMYLPLAAIVPLLVVMAYLLARRVSGSPESARPLAITAVGMLVVSLVFGVLDARRADLFCDDLAMWQDAERQYPDLAVIQVFKGVAYKRLGRMQEAMRHFERATQLNASSFPAQYNLARQFEMANRPKEAIAQYEKALRIRSDEPSAHNNLGVLLAAEGRTKEAMEHYREALRVSPNLPETQNNLASILFDSGSLDEAIEHYQRSLQLKPNIVVYRNLATAYLKANRPADAAATARAARDLARSEGQDALAKEIDDWLKSQDASQ